MISIELAKKLNEIIVSKSGGLAGIIDENSLSSALMEIKEEVCINALAVS